MAIYSGFSHQIWWFSIVMLVYQRVSNLAIDKKLSDYADYANWTGLVCRGYIRCVFFCFSFFTYRSIVYSIYLSIYIYSTMTCESTRLSLFGAALSNFQMFWEISGGYKQEFALASQSWSFTNLVSKSLAISERNNHAWLIRLYIINVHCNSWYRKFRALKTGWCHNDNRNKTKQVWGNINIDVPKFGIKHTSII